MCDCEKTEEKSTPMSSKISDFFLNSRKIFLSSEINDKVADEIVQKLIYLDSQSHEDIYLFVNSPGGVITSGMAILDATNAVKSDVRTIVTGQAASMGAMILANGAKGKRYSWPNARIMIHQPLISGNFQGNIVEIQTEAKEIDRMKTTLNNLLAEKTGQPIEKITKDTDRDFFMGSQEALEYGMVDVVETLI